MTINMKVRYTCDSCDHNWTVGRGVLEALIKQKNLSRDRYYVDYQVIAYQHYCNKCKVKGTLDPYDDELERVSIRLAKSILQKFGFTYEKEESEKKKCYARSKHRSDLC